MLKSFVTPILFACSVHLLGGCATEQVSLGELEVSLEYRPDLASLWLTNRIDAPGIVSHEVYLDGEPARAVPDPPLLFNTSSSLVTAFISPGTYDIGVASDRRVLVEADSMTLSPDRFNYVVVHGNMNAPAVVVLSDDMNEQPSDSRRVRLINVRDDEQDQVFALFDDDFDEPIPGTVVTLAHGQAWSELVSNAVRGIGFGDADGYWGVMEINCGPQIAILVDGQDDFTSHDLVPVDPANRCSGGGCECSDP